MPSLKRGFLFKYFDKIICAIVGLALLGGVAYALNRAGSLPKDIDPAYINKNAETIEQKLQGPAKALVPVALPSGAELGKVPNPPAMRSNIAIPPLPSEYAPVKAGLNKEFVLQFNAPLGEGTVVVQGDPVIEIVQHPVDGDFSKVKVRSKGYPGSAAVVGYEGRIAHIYPVTVDASVNKTAYPPTIQVTSRQGTVALKLVPDAKIDAEDVDVTYYEVWRRAWSDPLGKYEIADEVDKSGKSLRGSAPAAMPAPSPMAPAAAATGRVGGKPAAPEVPGIAWQDGNVKPGEQYSYKVRTVGGNTFPTEGEFCQPVTVEVLPDIDFRFAQTTQDTVGFDVVVSTGPTSAQRKTFWVGIGDEIGGVPKGANTEDYLTKDVLVDFHPVAVEPEKAGLSSRVIYADEMGNLHILWRAETRSDVLWDREKAASAPATGVRMPFGPMGPMLPPGR